MALTKLQEKDIRDRIIASMRHKGYEKGRVKRVTGKKMGDIKPSKSTHGVIKQYGADGKTYAQSFIDSLKSSGATKDLHKKGAQQGVKDVHKKKETGKSNLTLADNIKKSGYQNIGEVNTWAKAKMAQYNAKAKAGLINRSELQTFKQNVVKRRNKLKQKLAA